ncbi:hypothetical protein GO755_20440 [Spirosoma sp. HMF4905]|uniref:Uncharacterized protein n=1 Tax=Spirosoma arboris TaxID=2682092 RepID=A0A7K1SF31_9BACT|nr:hypothetical protein [Spirosoma arboris]MVM32427.1 hypothetical protein [Spirosoma arboris]
MHTHKADRYNTLYAILLDRWPDNRPMDVLNLAKAQDTNDQKLLAASISRLQKGLSSLLSQVNSSRASQQTLDDLHTQIQQLSDKQAAYDLIDQINNQLD